jgi:hypothetical protein
MHKACLVLTAVAALLQFVASASNVLPTVDLGYEVHQALSFNVRRYFSVLLHANDLQQTGQTYNFSNIRYAQNPVGDLRFAAPLAPTGRDPVVQNGSVGRICMQASPNWLPLASALELDIATGKLSSYNYTALNDALQQYLASTPPANQSDGRATEDCLFLDVIVPKAIFDKRNNTQNQGAPVIVW